MLLLRYLTVLCFTKTIKISIIGTIFGPPMTTVRKIADNYIHDLRSLSLQSS